MSGLRLYEKHRSILRRLDDLECRLASRVAAHRRRATNLVEEVPPSRRSHMRIFVSHRVEGGDDVDENDKDGKADGSPKATTSPSAASAGGGGGGRPGGKDFSALLHSSAHQNVAAPESKKQPSQNPKRDVRRWTLVVEGGLLIKHIDHESAKEVDSRLEAGLPILGCEGADDDAMETHNKAEIPLRDQWRGGVAEREHEKDVEPLIFTHLFDKVSVELTAVKPDKKPEPESSAVTRRGVGAAPAPDPPPEELKADVKSFTWERAKSNAPDSNAFFIVYDEESEFKPMGGKVFKSEFKVERIAAKIKLYRRQGDEGNFVPSPEMCGVFFPTFIGKKAAGELKMKEKEKRSKSKSKKRKRKGGGDIQRSSSVNLENDASNSSVGSTPIGKETESAAAPADAALKPSVPAEEQDFHVPNTVTMDEALHAIFFYIRTRNLQDATDLSIINNDEALSKLFGCSRMLFSAVRGLLIEKRLLVHVDPGTHPIIFNYDMTLDGAEPLTTKKRSVKAATPTSDTAEVATRRRSANAEPAESALSESEHPEDGPHQTMLSCDVEIEVPNLFHVRSRDILRRTKLREFEYTSSRTKALRSLVGTKVDEETAKQALAEAVSGKGYAPHHKQVWMALAKGSHEGGEAQQAAWIDLRTTALTEKLEEQCSSASAYWNVVNACRSLCSEKP